MEGSDVEMENAAFKQLFGMNYVHTPVSASEAAKH